MLGKLAKGLLAKGVRVDLEIFNKALVVKWMWCFVHEQESLWVKVLSGLLILVEGST